MTDTTAPTHRSAVFALAHEYVERVAALDPVSATGIGITAHDDRLTDYSPPAVEERADLARATLRALDALPVRDDVDRIAAAVMRERLGSALGLHDAGDHLRDVNVLACPVQTIRQVVQMTPAGDEHERVRLRERLAGVPDALASWRDALAEAAARGLPAARRQALAVAGQAEAFAGPGNGGAGWFSGYVDGLEASDAERHGLRSAAADAERGYAITAAWLRDDYGVRAAEVDGVGADRYARRARAWTGADLDLEATWSWGWEELDRITERMTVVGEALLPGATLPEVKAHLDAGDEFQIEGTDALLAFLSDLTASATDAMDGIWFDIDPRVRTCEVRLAAEGSAAAPYYTPVSEDLTRPGATWYPTRGQTRFPRWWLVSAWYHEGVPGHHLQFATAAVQRDRLSRFQRTFGWTSGYGEGWALYAEQLMDELGFFDDPVVGMGFLSSQAMRAARVVVDIGLHLGLPVPPGRGDLSGRPFDAATARTFLAERALLDDDFAASEVDRYLGLPGQAISYKVGERVWLAARLGARERLGAAFDLRRWHAHALGLGPMGLDPLADELAAYGAVGGPAGPPR